jgi:hypothetical protein
MLQVGIIDFGSTSDLYNPNTSTNLVNVSLHILDV